MSLLSARRWALLAAACGFLCSGLPAGCGIPDYHFADAPNSTGGNGGIQRPICSSSADCAAYADTKICDTTLGRCGECIPTAANACGASLYCNVNRCAVGCALDSDCSEGLTCDLATHQCSGCTADADCGAAMGCQDAHCVSVCKVDADCHAGFQCCAGTCASVASDPLHCGACALACASGEDCVNGKCGAGNGCRPGFADCDGNSANGCETNLGSDQQHCGSCQIDCTPNHCSGGTCTSVTCPDPNLADCDLLPANGCEANLTSVDTCGTCGNKCSDINGKPACSKGSCSIVCDAGFGDCDKNSDTGCETDLLRSDANCGTCGTACSNEHGTTACRDGACTPVCAQGFEDCDGNAANGCETNLLSPDSCGSCGASCALAHASALCGAGVCLVDQCNPGFEDCDGNAANGCEASLTNVESCGACGNACSSANGTPSCTSGACGIVCNTGFADCVNGAVDGCETNLGNNVLNCGSCGNACPVPAGGSASCVAGVCTQSSCHDPLADCNGDFTKPTGDGCETNVTSDVNNCGGCGVTCSFPHASAKCSAKACVLDVCNAGWANCDGNAANGCETQLGTTDNCGKCADACANGSPGAPRGSTKCSSGVCAPTCALGFGDCDGNPNNGCETPLNTNGNCGGCGSSCSRPNATTSCSSGTCTITGCSAGFGDCDNEGVAKDGCESRLNTTTNCGGCAISCSFANAGASCGSGTCSMGVCNGGFADCSASIAGCETQLGSAANCASCGDLCQTGASAHVTQNVCAGTLPNTACAPTCALGFKDCNANPSDGCETSITSVSNCGNCGVACTLAHTATQQCVSGSCQVGTCASGFADCNGTAADGCERPVSADINNCGGCNAACSANHGTPSCAGGACSIACASGWGDCNSNVADGCEHDVTSDPANCGACGRSCGSGSPFCVNSACKAHLDIVVVNSATSGAQAGTGANLSISHTLQTASGNHRLVLVGVSGRGNGTAGKPSSVTYNNVAMSLLQAVASTNQAWAGIYGILDSALPAATGSYTVLITAGSTQNTFGLVGNVLELRNAEQIMSVADAVGGSAGQNCSSDDPVDSITTVTDGALIYSLVSLYGEATPASGIATSGQSVTLQLATGNQLAGLAGLRGPITPPASVSIGWNPDNCQNSAQALVAVRPAIDP